MNPCEVTVHAQEKKKKAENVDAAKRQETRKPNTHIGSVWIKLIVAENLKLKTENTVAK